jgi:hypothetical protein
MAEANTPIEDKDALIKQAWDRWFEADYSWEGLRNKVWQDGKSLQDYWLTDLETGQIRTEEELIASGELIEVEDQKTYHIAHLPLEYHNKIETVKTRNRQVVQDQLNALIKARLLASATNNSPAQLRIKNKANFEGVVLLEFELSKENFNNTINANFNYCVFTGLADFVSAEFTRRVTFENATFIGGANFEKITFADRADFLRSKFLGLTIFNDATFNGDTDFRSTFSGEAHFNNAKFKGDANFTKVQFLSDSSFHEANFATTAFFVNTIFKRNIMFSRTTFSGSVHFHETTFSSEAYFSDAKFLSMAEFTEAIFIGKMDFSTANFENQAFFKSITWPEPVNWQGAFDLTVFKTVADFTGSGFTAFSAFDGAQFQKGLKLDRPESESTADALFAAELKGADESGADESEERIKALQVLESGCRLLKQEMAKQSDKNREQLLYKYELIARREQLPGLTSERIASRLYGFISDYGLSISKPTCCFIGTIAIFTLIYLLVFTPWPFYEGFSDKLLMATWASASCVFPFGAFGEGSLSFANDINSRGEPWRALIFMCFATLQSFIALILAFLFGLAVRRRFQIS